jgi:hypothetical protein
MMPKRVLEDLHTKTAVISDTPRTRAPAKPVNLQPIMASMQRLAEQFEPLLPLFEDLANMLHHIQEQNTLIISLLNSKLDLDQQEAELIDMLKAKIARER